MLQSLTGLIVKRRKLISAVFLIAASLGAFLMSHINVNYDIVSYLPASSESTIAINIMRREFSGAVSGTRVMAHDVSIPEALQLKRNLAAIDDVISVTWLDDIADILVPIEYTEAGIVERYYKLSNNTYDALFEVSVKVGHEAAGVKAIRELVGESGAVTGDAVYSANAQRLAGGESSKTMIIAIPLIFIILLLSTSSWIEPLLFLCSIGAAILINMGIDFFTSGISFITYAVSPVLQLAVSMDYAIFLVHAFEEHRTAEASAAEAMRKAIIQSLPAIAGSALTTLFGFFALCFMDFGIGLDLGLNLMKGVALSYLSVMVFLPALTMLCLKLVDKTTHKPILPKMGNIGKYTAKIRIPVLIIALLIAVPCFLAQDRSDFKYGTGSYDPQSQEGRDEIKINSTFGISNPMVVLVPKGDPVSELALTNELESIPHITSCLSYTKSAGLYTPPELAGEAVSSIFYSDNYARIIAYTSTGNDGEVPFAIVKQVRETAARYYSEYYTAGAGSNLYDVKTSVEKDKSFVNFLAIALCALVILVLYKSVSLPFILLLTIEIAVWINMSISYFTDNPIIYVGYIIVSTVQLGATIDYAILYTERYRKLRLTEPARKSAYLASGETFRSLLVSAATMTFAGIALSMASSSEVVQTLGILVARGTVLSFVMVNCVLPALLILLDKIVAATTFGNKNRKA